MSVNMKTVIKNAAPLRIGLVLAVALLALGLTQCAAHKDITAQFVAQGRHAQSVTVLPIQDPYLSADAAADYAERVAERMREWLPDVKVLLDDSVIGMPESEILNYAAKNVGTGHFLYGKIWSPRHGRDTYEVELLTCVTQNGRTVWSVAANTYNDDPKSSNWDESVSKAVDAILARLPEHMASM